ncbi:MAG: sugar ABC transporter permease [Actinomycetota bacterium]
MTVRSDPADLESAETEQKEPRRRKRFDWLPVWLIAPAVAIFAILLLWPVARAFQLSLFDVGLLDRTGGDFVGLGNYADLAGDNRFRHSAWVTVVYTVTVVVLSYALGLVTALLLNQEFRFRALARTAVILPWAVPEVVAVMTFAWILNTQFGVLNQVLMATWFVDRPIEWLTQSSLAMPSVIAVTVWKQFPLATLMLLAGLQLVPAALIEAAEVDGASRWQRFRHVTLPSMRSVNIILVLILILNTFRRTTIVYTMTGGGPAQATETLPVLTFLEAFQNRELGTASAVGTAVMVILALITIVYAMALLRKEQD